MTPSNARLVFDVHVQAQIDLFHAVSVALKDCPAVSWQVPNGWGLFIVYGGPVNDQRVELWDATNRTVASAGLDPAYVWTAVSPNERGVVELRREAR